MRTKDNWIDALKDYFANGDCPQEMKANTILKYLRFI